jgi:DNA topoisomerase I
LLDVLQDQIGDNKPNLPLQGKKLLRGMAVQRITFLEVTRSAVLAALAAPRDLATPLIEAYLARRALDYLLGFNLAPVLWRKLPAARSAGGCS